MSEQINAAVVRISSEGGKPVGAGMFVGQGKVITCAHVIRSALGKKNTPQEAPKEEIQLDFPLLGEDNELKGQVVLWKPELDVAGLEIVGEVPANAKASTFLTDDELWEHKFRAFGFPEGYQGGTWSSGLIRDRQSYGWLQIDSGDGSFHVKPGYSGAPVWDEKIKGFVGLVTRVTKKRDKPAAYIIPTKKLIEAWPVLAEEERQPWWVWILIVAIVFLVMALFFSSPIRSQLCAADIDLPFCPDPTPALTLPPEPVPPPVEPLIGAPPIIPPPADCPDDGFSVIRRNGLLPDIDGDGVPELEISRGRSADLTIRLHTADGCRASISDWPSLFRDQGELSPNNGDFTVANGGSADLLVTYEAPDEAIDFPITFPFVVEGSGPQTQFNRHLHIVVE